MSSDDVDPKVLRIRMEYAELMHEHYRTRVWALQDQARLAVARAEKAERALDEASKMAFYALVCSKHRGQAHGVGCPYCRAEQAEAAKVEAVRVAAARIVNLFEGALSISFGPTNEEAIEESRAQRGRKDG